MRAPVGHRGAMVCGAGPSQLVHQSCHREVNGLARTERTIAPHWRILTPAKVAGLAGDELGELYVAHTGNGSMRKIVLARCELSTIANAQRCPPACRLLYEE